MSLSSDMMNLVFFVLGTVIAIIFFLLGLTAKRPKLIADGSGAGGINAPGKDIMASNIAFRNHPTYLGLNIQRETANITSARLYDPALKELVGPVLKWRIDGTNELSQTISIRAGQTAYLYVFAKERYSEEYFAYSANNLNTEILDSHTKYKDLKKDFSVVLFDEIGRKYQFNITARNSNQSVDISLKVTWHMRSQMIGEALSLLTRAFSLRK